MTQEQALEILTTGANVFLTGQPGSGKTHTLNAYVAWLRSHSIEPALTASTGIAATHISGMTIHAWSGIGIIERLTPEDLDRITSKEHVVKRIQKTQVLIIDEISMLSGETLSMVEKVAREARHSDKPFGGIQVVLAGDFFQLPPIAKRGSTASFAFESTAWKSLNPIVCYLTEQHRQEDLKYLELLNAIRDGSFDHMHASTVLSREGDGMELDADIPQLFTHNADVDRLNNERLAALPAKAHVFPMQSAGSLPIIEGLKRGCLSPETLTLKEGAVVMCTKNNPAASYVNGTLGVVIGFVPVTGEPIIETHDGRELAITATDWAVEENGKVRAKITQVPLRLAWAITVHKSQGMSMDAAAIDLSRTFEYGQGYVALSRVRSLSGLTVLGWNEQATMVHPDVTRYDKDLREYTEHAGKTFAQIRESGELITLQTAFIKGAGGTLEVVDPENRPVKRSTYDETLTLLEQGMTFAETAKERDLTIGTICDHVEKLVLEKRISTDVLMDRLPVKIHDGLIELKPVFKKVGFEKLTPVFSKFKGKYSYDELKLARIFCHE